MLFESPIVSRGSGSIAGSTFSHNRGGNYIRARVTPVNPNTPAQSEIRAIMADLANKWVNTLTQVQRDAWDLYATNVPLPGPLGDPRNVGGLGMYIRSNASRLQVVIMPRVDDAPTIFDLGDFTPLPPGTVNEAADTITQAFTEADDWVSEDDGGMIFYTSRPTNPGINYHTGPYRQADMIPGAVAVPPTTPATMGLAFPVAAGQRIFYYVRVTRADGRLSALQRLTGLAV